MNNSSQSQYDSIVHLTMSVNDHFFNSLVKRFPRQTGKVLSAFPRYVAEKVGLKRASDVA